MFSNFKVSNEAKIENYIKRLISLLTGKEDINDEDFEILYKYSLATIKNHKFMDPDKFKIIRELKGISEKLIIHSQEEKAKRLEYLVKHLIQKKFKNQILDIHYVIMSLLLRISKSPLDNDFFEKKLKIYSPEKKKEQTIKDFCLHNKNAEKQIIYDEWGSFESSSDSDCKDDEFEKKCHKNENISQKIIANTPFIQSENKELVSGIFNRDLNTNQNIFDLPFESLDANIEKVKKRNFQEFFEENIVQKTVIIDEAYKKDKEEIERITKNSDIVNNPLILAETYKNFVMDRERYSHDEKDVFPFSHWIYKEKDERLIIEEIFQMFSSQETEIFALKKDEKYEYSIYYIKVKCQVSHLSPLALENILVEFVQMANSLQELEFLITDLQSISKGNIFDGFLNSIMKIKIGFYENLSNLQLLFHFQSYKITNKEIRTSLNPSFVDQLKKPISLLELRKNLTDKYSNSISWILRILKKTKNGVYEIKYHYSDNEENLNSLIVSQLLSFLYELLEDELTALNREDAPYFKIIITLFVDTFINYYSFMISWFKGDLLRDSFNEFMIKERKNQVATIEKRINWKRDFEFRKSRDIIIVPDFLRDYTENILNIGKSVRLLTYFIADRRDITGKSFEFYETDLHSEFYGKLLKSLTEKIPKENIFQTPTTNNFKTFYEEQILKDNNVNLDSIQKNKKTNIDFNMKEPQSDLKILNDIYNSKPDIKKFNIEGFNLKTINKSSVASKIEKDVFAPNEMNKTEKTNKKFFRNAFENLNPKEVDFSNFKIIFDRAIKNLIYNYQYEIDKKISEYVFKKLYFLEYLNCLRAFYFLEKAHHFQLFLMELFKKIDNFGSVGNIYGLNAILKEILKDLKKKTFQNISPEFSIEIETNNILAFKYFELNNLNLLFQVSYPLDIIFDNECLIFYNTIFKLLLKIKRSKYNITSKNFVIKKIKFNDVKIMKNSFEMEDYEVSLDDEEMNYSGNSSLIKNIQDNKMNNKKIFYLKHKCCMLQKNLNNFIDNYEQFIMDNIIFQYTKEFINSIKKKNGLEEIIFEHKEYLKKIINSCCLSEKNEKLLETFDVLFEICNKFSKLMNEMEILNVHSETVLSEIMNLNSECQRLLASFHKCNKLLFSILTQLKNEGRTQQPIIELLNKLNFNSYYMNDIGKYLQ